MNTGVLVALAALWGAAAGSLLPRAAYRFSVPSGEAWRDSCPGQHAIGGWIGWARCADCSARRRGGYGPSAPALTIATALVCAALAAATGARPELGVWLLLAPVGVLLTVVDFRVQRLPDVLTLPLAGAALALLGAVTLVPEHAGHWPTALYAAAALGAAFFLLFLINPGGMGFGDVKLAVGLGAVLGWYGWATVMLGTFAAFLLGACYGGVLVLARRAGRKTAIPFGPFLLSGAFLGLLIGAFAA
ncbi:prepilin peptidase [Streptomyces cylindrosporus]|uniref:A24 family peptidase n=1 Tax=Streptomyces cylindrosporus TaxID=2927583 RepID=A0ABS9YPX5_9ACTN|nr:prepilin peptidase [Streptomyces cylindrosporus]MCI3279272.1 A24 family peptidase [Streptomyces cylindrosporus]